MTYKKRSSFLITIIEKMLKPIGNFINKVPTKEENQNLYHSPIQKEPLWHKVKIKRKPTKAPYPQPKAKGSPKSETTLFNHPRR